MNDNIVAIYDQWSKKKMKCPDCGEEFTPTLEEIAKDIEKIYPQHIFKGHPITWVRRLLKFLSGMDYHVLIDEKNYTRWARIEEE